MTQKVTQVGRSVACSNFKMSIYHGWVLNISSVGKCVSFVTEPKILCEVGAEAKEHEEEGGQHCDRLTFFPALNEMPAVTESSPSPFTPKPCSNTQDCSDIRIILQELHPGEEVLFCSTGGCVGMRG